MLKFFFAFEQFIYPTPSHVNAVVGISAHGKHTGRYTPMNACGELYHDNE